MYAWSSNTALQPRPQSNQVPPCASTDGCLPVEHSIQGQVVLPVLLVTNGDNLLKALDQNEQYQQRQCHRPHVHNEAECSYHDESENASSPPLSPATVHLAQDDTQGPSAARVLGGHQQRCQVQVSNGGREGIAQGSVV